MKNLIFRNLSREIDVYILESILLERGAWYGAYKRKRNAIKKTDHLGIHSGIYLYTRVNHTSV
ncbi:hypothetical protein J2S17_003280 [Cytobacillus purgationiresistens]|uniref:Uncharacterized protein n=1 Tax=Cytobacillus purgationiresistens TaxID=863449 RepID=A0ABU0AJE8_9BACI|nr:hypothetical protein [Cytobacillus purgationiresistens]